MKVKDLILILSKLEQDKEIKIVVASGYEYETECSKEFGIKEYKDAHITAFNGSKIPFYDNHEDDNKDFYLITE